MNEQYNVIVLEDEEIAREGLVDSLRELRPDFCVKGFAKVPDALDYASKEKIDIAFLDIHLNDGNGIDVAEEIRKLDSTTNIIFTTAYSDYTMDAMNLHASGYILKPVTKKKLEKELSDLRYTSKTNEFKEDISERRMKARAFGDFQVFVGETPIKFKYSKTKEMLAYLIDRKGALCTKGDICAILFGDEYGSKNSYYNNIHSDLRNTMHEMGMDDVIVVKRGKLGVRTDLIDCDYYKWLDNPSSVEHIYMGEYMNQYSWAEYTNAWLSSNSDSINADW